MRSRICWIAFVLTMAPAAVQAETFILKDGDVVAGTVLRSLGNTLSIKLDDGGMHQLPLSAIDQVEITAGDGARIGGRFSGWADGVYLLVTDQGLIEVKDGVVSKVTDDQAPIAEAELVQPSLDEGSVAPAPAARSLSDGELPQKLEPTM
ncbi:MAG: hypothetical protein OEU92_33115 [Alphaproteobacteria bacterium]|nr:hypothetical protein [Alphaproteobacteria bacterium]